MPISQWWKNSTFLVGLFGLILGALYLDYPDWDIRVSILMALSTYLTADKFILAIKQKSYSKVALLTLGAWWSIDGVYWLYWSLVDTTVMIREGQWSASLCLYLLCGLVWVSFDPERLPKDHYLRRVILQLLGPKKHQT